MWQSLPWQTKKLDANLIDWIVRLSMLSVSVTLLWIFIYKNEIIYSVYHIIQTLKLYFSILFITKNLQNQRGSNNWKHVITFEWFIKSIFIEVKLLYNVALFSAVHEVNQVYVYIPSLLLGPPSHLYPSLPFQEFIANFLHVLLKKNQGHFKFETGHLFR